MCFADGIVAQRISPWKHGRIVATVGAGIDDPVLSVAAGAWKEAQLDSRRGP